MGKEKKREHFLCMDTQIKPEVTTKMAAPMVFISDSTKKALQKFVKTIPQETYGLLAGVRKSGKTFQITCVLNVQSAFKSFNKDLLQNQLLFPQGTEIFGIFFSIGNAPNKSNVLSTIKKLNLQENLPNCLVCCINRNQPEVDSSSFFYCAMNETENTIIDNLVIETDAGITTPDMFFRVQGTVPLTFEYSAKEDLLIENIETEVDILQEKVQSSITIFHVENSQVLLRHQRLDNERLHTYNTVGKSCGDILEEIENEDGYRGKKKKRGSSVNKEVVNVNMLFQITGDEAVRTKAGCAPIIHHEHREFKTISIPLPLDVIVQVHSSDPAECLPNLLTQGVCRQLTAMKLSLLLHKQSSTFHTPQPYHFQPQGFEHLITLVFPEGINDDKLELYRRSLHEKFDLPMDRPQFRRSNVYIFPGEQGQGGYLVNPHVGLGPSGVKEGKQSIVQGLYTYHHYMQDHFDDDKWGCAYRSLQTLISWFRLQGYVDCPNYSHKEIQQALVDMGDKEASFVGSRKWIGSTEVSYCLDHFLGVSSKIMFVSNGAELSSKGRELAHHFQTQGTPIMIGGGVLAHTILGVDFNDSTGDIKFLILDPHYTGGEDLKTIQDKGWCGWKGPDFWDKNAYYNLCMPQRPNVI